MKGLLKFALWFGIGFFIVSSAFADYTPVTWITLDSYWFTTGWYELNLKSETSISQDIYINWFWTYTKLDATFCEMWYSSNYFVNWYYHRICWKMTDFFSPNNISNVYFYVEWAWYVPLMTYNGTWIIVENWSLTLMQDWNSAYIKSNFEITKFLPVIVILFAWMRVLNKIFNFIPLKQN